MTSEHITGESVESLDVYYTKFKPGLKRTFSLYLETLTGLSIAPSVVADIAHRLTLASEHLYISPATIRVAASRDELPAFARIVYSLSRLRTAVASKFIDGYRSARFSLTRVEEMLLEEVSDGFMSLERPDSVFSFCMSSASTEQFMVFARLFGTMARRAPRSVPAFFKLFETVRKTCEWPTIRDWIARGVDLISSARVEEGISYLLGLSKESRVLLGMRFAVLEDRKNVLHIYCTSFGGRVYNVQNYGVSTFGVRRPYTDGASIFLPETLDLFTTISANEAAFTVLATIQASFIQNGTFSFEERSINFGEELQRRYGTTLPSVMEETEKRYGAAARTVRERATGEVEAVFGNDRVLTLLETPHETHFFRYPTPDLIAELFSMVERIRIEYKIASRYPGFSDDIEKLNAAIRASLPEPLADPAGLPDEFRSVLERAIRLSLGGIHRATEDYPRMARVIEFIRDRFESVRRENATIYDTARECFEIYNRLYDTYPVVPWCTENEVRDIFDHQCIATIVPEIVADVSPELVTGLEEKPEFVSTEDRDEKDIDLTSLNKSERKAHDLREAILSGNIQIFRYPEYDTFKGSYIPRHCTLYESSLESSTADYYLEAIATHQQTYKKLKKRFLVMQPDAMQIQRKWLDGEDIHIGDATDFVTDLMRGSTPDDKIYVRRNRNERSIAAAILVDASSSTKELVNGRPIIEIEKTALSLLASALSIVGDTFGIFTFFSMGRQNVFFSAVKRFDESWTERTQSRIGSISANASNRDGCAIRHAAELLMQQEERTKLLIMLSDGIPADSGYGTTTATDTNPYAIEDTRRAITEARVHGIVPYCITIDRNARDYTPRLYGEYNYTVLSDVTRLPEKLASFYLNLTK